MKKSAFVLFLMACIFTMTMGMGEASVTLNQQAPNFTLTDSNGQQHSLKDYKGKFVVLEWVNYECPFVIKHYKSNNMQALQKKYTAKNVIWLSINSSAKGKQGNYEPNQINEIISNADASPSAYLIDEDGKVGQEYGAQTTPHMYIINSEGELIYQGAIDDNPSFDTKDIPTSKNYVQTVLDAVMSGNVIETPSTKSYGCSVKY